MKKIFLILIIFSVIFISGCITGDQRPGRPFGNFTPGEGPPRGNFTNFTMDEENVTRVSGVFESAESQDDVDSYCSEHMFECMYYCRNVDPGHEMCAGMIDPRNFGGVSR